MMTRQHTTLQDIMKPFDAIQLAALFYDMGYSSVERGDYSPFGLVAHLSSDKREKYQCKFTEFQKECERLNLNVSARMVSRAIEKLSTVTLHQFGDLCEDLHECLIAELQPIIFLCINPQDRELFSADNLFGDKVTEAFPSAKNDIRDASRCLALDCWTATVMHSMRILEVGLKTMATQLGIPFNRDNWGDIIKKIETTIEENRKKGNKDWKTQDVFYSKAALQFRFFKVAWRDHTMHGNNTYDETDAETVYQHTKEFMSDLATRLKEDAAND